MMTKHLAVCVRRWSKHQQTVSALFAPLLKERVCVVLSQIRVEKVHTLNVLGKTKYDTLTRKPFKRPDYKKAYVFLKDEKFEVCQLLA